MRERDVQRLFCHEVQKKFPKLRVFRRNVGVFKTSYEGYVRIEHKGMADIYAFYPTPYGLIHLEFEIKGRGGQLSSAQKNWQQFIEDNNGFYYVVTLDNMRDCFEAIRSRVSCLDKRAVSPHKSL